MCMKLLTQCLIIQKSFTLSAIIIVTANTSIVVVINTWISCIHFNICYFHLSHERANCLNVVSQPFLYPSVQHTAFYWVAEKEKKMNEHGPSHVYTLMIVFLHNNKYIPNTVKDVQKENEE